MEIDKIKMKDLRYKKYLYLFIILYVLSMRFTKLNFLFDHSGQIVTCTLQDDLCLQLVNYLEETDGMETLVIMLRHARIKEAQGFALLICFFYIKMVAWSYFFFYLIF